VSHHEHTFYTGTVNAPEQERTSAAATDSRHALARVVAEVHQRWGAGSLTYRDATDPRASVGRIPAPASPPSLRERGVQVALPPWWPGATSRDGRPLPVPPILEVGMATGAGRLTFMLAWAVALRPDLMAIIDGSPIGDGARLYPPAVMAAGLPSTCRPIVVRPGGETLISYASVRDATRAIVDALFILLRSEAFDAILCPMPSGARVTTATANTLASMAARAGTALVVMTGHGAVARGAEPPALLGPSAAYRLVIADHQWAWRDGELSGLRLEVHTHRARGGAEASMSHGTAQVSHGTTQTLATHVLNFRLRRIMRDGPTVGATGTGIDGTSWELSGVTVGCLAEREGDPAADTNLASAV
jgi:hypothetical protein